MIEEESWHGTIGGYSNHGCRQERCKQAMRDYAKKRRIERQAQLKEDPFVVRHGLLSTYLNWGCRGETCEGACSAANAKYHRERRAKRKK